MLISVTLKEGMRERLISLNMPTLTLPPLSVNYYDPRWARPFVFWDFSSYPFAEAAEAHNDFNTLVNYVNRSSKTPQIERFKEGLTKLIDAHITRAGRILFCDLLMYVDSFAFLCYASDLMTEEEVQSNYAQWVNFLVKTKRSYLQSSTKYFAIPYEGSQAESDLRSLLN